MHHSEHIERDEPVPRPDFDGGEVCGKDRIPVSLQKRGPRLRALAIRCGFDAVGLQYIGHSGIGDVVAEVPESSLNPVVAPR